MKFHAIITIVDDNNKEITHFHKEEDEQFKDIFNNTICHKFNLGYYSIAESQELRSFLELGNVPTVVSYKEAENDQTEETTDRGEPVS